MTDRKNNPEFLHTELLKLLRVIDFGRRYLQQQAALTSTVGRNDHSIEPHVTQKILSESGLPFRYFKKERFFGYIDRHHGYDVLLHLTIRRSTAEFALFVSSNLGVAGGRGHNSPH
ncbi:hypothetical protein [Nocardia brasiliensis]|uniref:hypothetical protein n=1 Tax=Nocardia brasiliensis TaxID=37326 RepID=UPI003D8BFB0E